MNTLIRQLTTHPRQATSAEIDRLTRGAAQAPFCPDLLEVDPPMWGSFWQGDVLAPGYLLPAAELALLRAVRLDGDWPNHTTLPQYVAHLRAAILHPQAGVWTLAPAKTPCAVFAAPEQSRPLVTVVWYCAVTGCLHAGYKTAPGRLRLPGAVAHRWLPTHIMETLPSTALPPPARLTEHAAPGPAARLDRAILRLRRAAS